MKLILLSTLLSVTHLQANEILFEGKLVQPVTMKMDNGSELYTSILEVITPLQGGLHKGQRISLFSRLAEPRVQELNLPAVFRGALLNRSDKTQAYFGNGALLLKKSANQPREFVAGSNIVFTKYQGLNSFSDEYDPIRTISYIDFLERLLANAKTDLDRDAIQKALEIECLN